MATAIGNLFIRIGADTKKLDADLRAAQRRLKASAKEFKSIGSDLSQTVSLPIIAIGAGAVKAFGDLEALQKGLISVMGSAEAAGAEFTKLKEVAKLPGLGLEEAVKGSVNLQSAGFSADQAREALLQFGNALATVGKGKNELNLVVLALTQLQNKASGFGQDLRQLVEQLPQLRGALTNAFGTADSEAIAKLGVTGKQVVETLIGEFSKLPRVSGGIKNAFENLSDSTKIAFANLGEALNKSLNIEGLLNKISNFVTNAANAFARLSPETQRLIIGLAGIAAAVGPILFAIGTLSSGVSAGIGVVRAFVTVGLTGFTSILSVLGPVGIAIAGITAAVAAGIAIYKLSGQTAVSAYESERKKLGELVEAAKKNNDNQDVRKALYDEIKQRYPDYLKNIDLEKEGIAGLNKLLKEYNNTNNLASAREEDRQRKLIDLQEEKKGILQNIVKIETGILPDFVKEFGLKQANKELDEINKKIKEIAVTGGTYRGGAFIRNTGGGGSSSVPTIAPKASSGKKVAPFSTLPEDVAIRAGLQANDITLPFTGQLPQVNKFPEAIGSKVLSPIKSVGNEIAKIRDEMKKTFQDGFESSTEYAARKLAELAEATAAKWDSIKNTINSVTDIASNIGGALSNIFSTLNNNETLEAENRAARDKKFIEQTVKNEDEKAKRIAIIDNRLAEEKKKIARKQAIQNKLAAIFDASIATARAIAQALPNVALSIVAGALGAAQIAAIAATPLPSLAIGTNRVNRSGLAEIHRGEAIVPADVVQGGFTGGNSQVEVIGKISGTDIIIGTKNSSELYNRMFA